ncbi:MAG: S9 family peptidase [Acidobacteria bacterium]|nr:S9 family peptidase [Acidobacteriota bacterium]
MHAPAILRAAALAAVVLVCPFAPAEPQRPMSELDVARLRSVGEVALDPEGRTVAYTLGVPREPGRDDDGGAWSELHVVPYEGGASRAFVAGKVNVYQVRWSPDGRALSYLAKRGDDKHVSIWALPAAGGESVPLARQAEDIRWHDWRADGKAIAFVATEPLGEATRALRDKGFDQRVFEEDWLPRRVYVLEMPGGPLGQPGAVRALAVEGQPWRVFWSPDGTRLLVDPSPTPLVDDEYMSRRLTVVDAATGRTLARVEHEGKLGAAAWSPDGRAIAFVAAEGLADTREGRLMIASAGGGAARDLLPGLPGHVEALHFAPDGSLLYTASLGVTTRVGRVRADGSGAETIAELAEPVWGALSADRTARHFALEGQSPAHPPEAFAFEPGSSPRRLTDSNPWLAGIQLARQEVVLWNARDGLALEGLLIHPLAAPAAAPPLIVVAHGGPEQHYKNGWLTRYSDPGQVAAGRGYAVFYPNYRGSTGRGVAFARSSQGATVGAEFDDILDGIDALAQRGVCDAKRVGITGGSYGGLFTAWAATRYSQRFAAAVMFAGISENLSKSLGTDIPREDELVHWLAAPLDKPQLFLNSSPLLQVARAHTPLLILHGTADTRIDPSQSRMLYRALKRKGDVPVRLVLYPGEGHGNRRAAARYDLSLRLMQWFDHFLVAGRADLPAWQIDYGLPPAAAAAPGEP